MAKTAKSKEADGCLHEVALKLDKHTGKLAGGASNYAMRPVGDGVGSELGTAYGIAGLGVWWPAPE